MTKEAKRFAERIRVYKRKPRQYYRRHRKI